MFANNKLFDVHLLDKIDIGRDDVCIFFNHLIPFSIWPQLKELTCTRYYFSRYRAKTHIPVPETYAGLDKFTHIRDLFDKVFLYRMPDTLGDKELANKCRACIEYYKLDSHPNLDSIYNLSVLKKKYSVNITRSLSSGLLMYLYLLDKKNINDTIVLVGFTSQVNTNYHDAEQEKAFFEKELKNNYVQAYQ